MSAGFLPPTRRRAGGSARLLRSAEPGASLAWPLRASAGLRRRGVVGGGCPCRRRAAAGGGLPARGGEVRVAAGDGDVAPPARTKNIPPRHAGHHHHRETRPGSKPARRKPYRSEEHTSELQSL